MKKEGYLWLVYAPLREGDCLEIRDEATEKTMKLIKTDYEKIAGSCVKFETQEVIEHCAVILTESNEIELTEPQIRLYVFRILTEEPLNPPVEGIGDVFLPLGKPVHDTDGNTFHVVSVEKSSPYPKLTVEYNNTWSK